MYYAIQRVVREEPQPSIVKLYVAIGGSTGA